MRRLDLILILVLVISTLSFASYLIDINIPEYTLRLYYEDKLVKTFPIAVGKSVTPSILGDFKIVNIVKDPTWYPQGQEPVTTCKYNPLGPWWLGIDYPGYGIHGNNSPSSIGKAQSAGCIRMNNEDVTYLASIIQKGTPVRLRYDVFVASTNKGPFQLTIYPDIYGLGVNTVQNLRSFVLGFGEKADTRDWVLKEFIKNSNKKPYPLPKSIDVFVNGTNYIGYKIAQEYAISLDALEEHIEFNTSTKSYYIDGRKVKTTESNKEFAYLSTLEADFWFGARTGSNITLDIYTALFNDKSIGRVLKKQDHLFNASIVAKELGSSLYTNPKLQAAMIDGQIILEPIFYNDDLYLTEAQLVDYLALGVRFEADKYVAIVEALPVFYGNTRLELDGYFYKSKAYVPILAFEASGADIEWVDRINERVKVDGIILKANKARGNNFYVSAEDYARLTGNLVEIESAGIYLEEPKDTSAM